MSIAFPLKPLNEFTRPAFPALVDPVDLLYDVLQPLRAEARRVFNETARGYNTEVRRFPANLIAGIFNFSTKGYFTADEAARTAPKVEF